jgi:FixJ family two-component response regulator
MGLRDSRAGTHRLERPPIVSLIGVVDDDESVRDALSSLIRSAGFQCALFSSAEEFLDSGPLETDCLLLDIRMRGQSGLELQERLHELNVAIPVIFVTGHADDGLRARALKQGAVAFFAKPFDDEALLGAVQAAIQSGHG